MRDQPGGYIGLALSCLFAVAAIVGCGHGGQADSSGAARQSELPVVKAAVIMIEQRPWPGIVRTQGSLIADEVTVVGAKLAGRVAEVDVDFGDVVPADQPLATLDQDEFRLQISLADAQLLQARAALGLKPADPVEGLDPLSSPPVKEAKAVWDESKTRVDRIRQLRARSAVTQEELDQAVAAEEVASARYGSAINGVREKIAQIGVRAAELSLAGQRLTDTVVRAPFEGFVQERHVARGSFVQVGSPIVTLVRTGALRFRGAMPERHAQKLALGQQLTLTIEGVEQPLPATVTRISPGIDEMNRSLVFEAEVENRDGSLRTGLFAEAEVVVDRAARAIVVPQSAVAEFAGAEKVWKVVEGVAREQVVQTVHRGSPEVEIVSGLAAGDLILRDAIQGRVARIEPIADDTAISMSAVSTGVTVNGAADENRPTSTESPTASSPTADPAAER